MNHWTYWYSSYQIWRRDFTNTHFRNAIDNHIESITDELSLTTGEMR